MAAAAAAGGIGMTALRRFGAMVVASMLVACAALPGTSQPGALRLSPASLGRDLALQQRMTVTVNGRSELMDVAVEVDAQAVRVAVLQFGQTVARLEWDGRALVESRAPGVPDAISGARVLSDLQMVHWPVAAIAPALPRGWTVRNEDGVRVVRAGERTVLRVRYPAPGSAELDNLEGGYRVRLDGLAGAQAQ
ncbi:MAG: DUF3261 domain-containing protein [Comamonadaceae bacterium]|nr:MAG: DUF3261 domain-containing protein [Comamonadaceae bacterium]